MAFSFDEEYIKNFLGDIIYNGGRDMYLRNKIRKVDILENSENTFSITSTVESAYDLKDYKVNILTNTKNGAMYCACNCDSYKSNRKCKHIAAVLIKMSREGIKGKFFKDSSLVNGVELLQYYKENLVKNYKENQLINLEVKLEIIDRDYKNYSIELKVGVDKLYIIKNIKEFIESIFLNKQIIEFGKELTFDPNIFTFRDEDYKVLTLIKEIYDVNQQINDLTFANRAMFISGKKVFLTETQLLKFLELKNKKYTFININGVDYKDIEVCLEDMPIDFNLYIDNDEVNLSLMEEVPKAVDKNLKLFIFKNKLYIPREKQLNVFTPIYKVLQTYKSSTIQFKKEDIQSIATYVLPQIKSICNTLVIDNNLKALMKEEPLKIKIYLDKENDEIICNIIFNYGEIEFNLFQELIQPHDVIIIRNVDEEKKILKELINLGFHQVKDKLILKDEDLILELITSGMNSLKELGEVYYSDSFKNIKVITSKNFKSTISLNNSNLLEFDFSIEGVDIKELNEVFISLKHKKKYHKLKNGALIPLFSKEIKDLNYLVESLDLDVSKFAKGKLIIPKYASLYIDEKVEQGNLNFIWRNEGFKELVNTIRGIKDAEYFIPIGITASLREYQKIGFKWFKTLSQYDFGGILCDEMGLGKTLQAITYISSEIEEGNLKGQSLIVCPTSLIYNWLAEFEKFAPTLKVLVISGSKSERTSQMEEILNYDVIITSYPLIRRDIDDYRNFNFSICIIDEAQQIKNPLSLNAQSVKEIKAMKRFALTGTPIENSLTELWSIFDFIMPGYLKSHRRFMKSFEIPIVKDKDENILQELLKLIRPFILRRFKKDVALELPPKIEHKVVIEMTDEQKKVYASYINSFNKEMKQEIREKGFNKSKFKILSLLTRLRQICCDPSTFIENYTGDSGKYIALEEIIEESLANNHRILLFSQFTSNLKIIKGRLENLGIKTMYLDGTIPSKERLEMVREFNESQKEVFLISLKAGGTGLNLVGADLVIHFDPWWNPAVEDQAVDRAHRIGQTKTVEVIKLITKGTIEEKIYQLQEKKKDIIQAVLDKDSQSEVFLSSMTEEELEELFKV